MQAYTVEDGLEAGAARPGRFSDVDLEELRKPVLTGLVAVAIAISWVWIATVATAEGQAPQVRSLLPPGILFVVSGAVLIGTKAPFRWRCFAFLAAAGVTLALRVAWSGSVVWLYYQSLLVTVAALLLGPGASFGAAALLSASAVPAFGGAPRLLPAEALPAIGLMWSTAVAAWLSSRNLYTVLLWAMESQARAWRTANEVRRRREQLRRTLDSLRNAHIALERTTRELEDARVEADEARKVKSRFVANISHELRTPLNIIVGFAEILCFSPETYGDFEWPPALRDDVVTIWRNAEHLLNMVDDVLDLAQIEASRLPVAPEPTDLPQLIRDTLVSASALLRDSGLDVRISLPAPAVPVNLDRTRIRQVLLNLINNAIRFTAEGHIEVGCRLSEKEAVVYVRDSGEGIPPDRLRAIFDEFEQVDTSIRRRHQGIGLGLTISRHFIRLHGGRMWAESEAGAGSTFYFALPLPMSQTAVQPLEARRYRPADERSAEAPSYAVALCRDAGVTRILERHLEDTRVLGGHTVEEVVALVRERHPDVVYVAADTVEDMPEALESARHILRQVSPLDLPVVVSGFPSERRAGAALGVPEFLTKPVTQKQVAAAIRRLCPHPRRLLLVDDEADMAGLLARMVAAEWPQAEVLIASSGAEAMALLPRRPDVVLLDLIMPGMNGIDFLGALRADPDTAGLPVVVVTARGPARELASVAEGELHVLRQGGFAAAELVRLLHLISRAVPPTYAGTAAPTGSPVAEPI